MILKNIEDFFSAAYLESLLEDLHLELQTNPPLFDLIKCMLNLELLTSHIAHFSHSISIRNCEPFLLMRVLGQDGHKLVQLRKKLLLHVVRPSTIMQELWDEFLVHHFKESFQVIAFYHSICDVLSNILLGDLVVLNHRELQEVSKIKVITILI